jgi:hypothetical protein
VIDVAAVEQEHISDVYALTCLGHKAAKTGEPHRRSEVIVRLEMSLRVM